MSFFWQVREAQNYFQNDNFWFETSFVSTIIKQTRDDLKIETIFLVKIVNYCTDKMHLKTEI